MNFWKNAKQSIKRATRVKIQYVIKIKNIICAFVKTNTSVIRFVNLEKNLNNFKNNKFNDVKNRDSSQNFNKCLPNVYQKNYFSFFITR